ncbi:MAG: hypothetical protein EOP04_21350 [Proteobacteria bacterium]|nr:MAG: hypothetical protein EOP04_21350 [Pseudomonadota bacterium]
MTTIQKFSTITLALFASFSFTQSAWSQEPAGQKPAKKSSLSPQKSASQKSNEEYERAIQESWANINKYAPLSPEGIRNTSLIMIDSKNKSNRQVAIQLWSGLTSAAQSAMELIKPDAQDAQHEMNKIKANPKHGAPSGSL